MLLAVTRPEAAPEGPAPTRAELRRAWTEVALDLLQAAFPTHESRPASLAADLCRALNLPLQHPGRAIDFAAMPENAVLRDFLDAGLREPAGALLRHCLDYGPAALGLHYTSLRNGLALGCPRPVGLYLGACPKERLASLMSDAVFWKDAGMIRLMLGTGVGVRDLPDRTLRELDILLDTTEPDLSSAFQALRDTRTAHGLIEARRRFRLETQFAEDIALGIRPA